MCEREREREGESERKREIHGINPLYLELSITIIFASLNDFRHTANLGKKKRNF